MFVSRGPIFPFTEIYLVTSAMLTVSSPVTSMRRQFSLFTGEHEFAGWRVVRVGMFDDVGHDAPAEVHADDEG
ncbi:hypothetical protein ACWEQV_27925 [Rhodococcus aetherivorans]